MIKFELRHQNVRHKQPEKRINTVQALSEEGSVRIVKKKVTYPPLAAVSSLLHGGEDIISLELGSFIRNSLKIVCLPLERDRSNKYNLYTVSRSVFLHLILRAFWQAGTAITSMQQSKVQ